MAKIPVVNSHLLHNQDLLEEDWLPRNDAPKRSCFLNDWLDQTWTLQEVLDLMAKPNSLAWGFGHTSPWPLDIWSEPVLPWTKQQQECFGYIKARGYVVTALENGEYERVPLVPGTTDLVDEEYDEPGDYWLVMVNGKLKHDDIKAASAPIAYRSIGLYESVKYKVTDPVKLAAGYDTRTNPWFMTHELSGNLVWLQHLDPPRYITPRLEVDINVLLRFKKAPVI
jgi:hypothetical protein